MPTQYQEEGGDSDSQHEDEWLQFLDSQCEETMLNPRN